jgi:hypothetical protein
MYQHNYLLYLQYGWRQKDKYKIVAKKNRNVMGEWVLYTIDLLYCI